jgi:hypothetical protein
MPKMLDVLEMLGMLEMPTARRPPPARRSPVFARPRAVAVRQNYGISVGALNVFGTPENR